MTSGSSRVVSFDCDGFKLYGSLHEPSGDRVDAAVIVLNQGPVDRSGAHRLSIKLANRWVGQGLTVLRFDARGVGESEGDWAQPSDGSPIQRLYKNVEEGAWEADALAAVDFVRRATGIRRVLMTGLCGGAVTAVYAAATHADIKSVAMVAMPIRPQAEILGVADLVESHIKAEAARYASRAFEPAAWKRFLTLQTDYKTMWDVLARRAGRVVGRPAGPGPQLNAPLVKRFEAALKAGKQLTFIYPENDYLWVEFQELFLAHYGSRSGAFEVRTIPQANHTFTEPGWQDQLITVMAEWAEAHTKVSSTI